MEVQTVDGRVITIASALTQTDWDWVEQSLRKESSYVIEDPQETTVEELLVGPEDKIDPEFKIREGERIQGHEVFELRNLFTVGPPTFLAYRPESKQPLMVSKMPAVWTQSQLELSSQTIACDYCHEPCESFVSREQIEKTSASELLFCCEKAQRARLNILEEERALADVEVERKIDVGPHPPFMSRQQKKAAKERAQQRLREFGLQRVQNTGQQNRFFSGGQQIKTISYRLSNGEWTIHEECSPEPVQADSPDIFSLQEEKPVKAKRKQVLLRYYPDSSPFLTLFPDGTGNVFYPSGCIAIAISSVGPGDLTYTVWEDTPSKPNIHAIFTSRGHSTCYHPNGLIWVNLSQLEGIQCSETGALRQRWSWHDFDHHLHPLPLQPLYLSLNPFVSLRILTQKSMYLTFSHCTCRVRFNVGAKLKLTYPDGLVLPGPDTLQKHLQMKCLEIYSLLDRLQTQEAYQHAFSQQNIQPVYRLQAQMERLQRQMDRASSPRTLKTQTAVEEVKTFDI